MHYTNDETYHTNFRVKLSIWLMTRVSIGNIVQWKKEIKSKDRENGDHLLAVLHQNSQNKKKKNGSF